MKKQLLAVLLTGCLTAQDARAQSTSYEPVAGLLEVPCVATFDPAGGTDQLVTYRARLRSTGSASRFVIDTLAPTDFDTDCSGTFDSATGRFTDILNIGDDSWELALRRGADGVFTMETLRPRGAAQTSLWIARAGTNVVYLAGTVHVLRASDYPLPRAYDEAYERSAALYFERDMDASAGAHPSAEQMRQLMRDPQGKTLAQQLAPETYARLGAYLRENWQLEVDAVNDWSAQMFVSAFSYEQLERRHGVDAAGVDHYLAQRARADGKAIEGFESMASQYAVLQALDEGQEDELMLSFLEAAASDADIAGFDRLVQLWRSGDTATLNREDIVPMRANDYADYQLIQVQRNAAWLPQIEALLQTPQTEMIVVGVAHMVGSDGLIALLRKRGYHVEKY